MNGGGQDARLPCFVVSVAASPELPPVSPLRSPKFIACFFSGAEFGLGSVPNLANVGDGLQGFRGLRLSGVTGLSNNNLGYPHNLS